MILFGNRLVTDIINYGEVILEWGGYLTQYDKCGYIKGESGLGIPTGRMPREDEGRDPSTDLRSQETPTIVRKPLEARGEAWNGFSGFSSWVS